MRIYALIALLTLAGAGCSEIQTESASPSDPNYQRTGAPRVGEPAIQPNNAYGRIMGGDGHSPL